MDNGVCTQDNGGGDNPNISGGTNNDIFGKPPVVLPAFVRGMGDGEGDQLTEENRCSSERVDRLKERREKSQRYKEVVVDEGCIEDAPPTEWVAPDPNLLTMDLLQNDRTYKAMHMRAMVKKWTSLDISYRIAWRGREKTLEEIQGSFGQSHQLLNTYSKEMRKVDRFSFIELQRVGNTNRFKCYFWSYGITVRSFRHTCRPHIEIDGTHLRGRSRGCLISAIVVDGDNHVFPVAFGLVSGEDNKNYDWFLRCLGDQVIGYETPLVIISDRIPVW
ncbi:hypothetical protein IFM89_035843 [Coptis chinensis]|uniref:MULE transposase domain-containing protein n=1 Tax=Coptis chinensis TaxID=261450 RepID=A0A835LSN2_9MAGN|nr:hypothetical protein IFM89_035843 [Coptis chinensis]